MPQQGEGSDSASTEEEKVDDSSMSTMQEMSEDIYIVEKGRYASQNQQESIRGQRTCRCDLQNERVVGRKPDFIGQKLILP